MKLTFEESLDLIKLWSGRCQNLRDYLDKDNVKKKYKAAKLLSSMNHRVAELYSMSYKCFYLYMNGTIKERQKMKETFFKFTSKR